MFDIPLISTQRSELLNHTDFNKQAGELIFKAKEEIVVISAFVKMKGVEWLLSKSNPKVKKTIYSRWTADDLLSGASDLSCYKLAKQHSIKFFINQSLHSKVIIIDKSFFIIGSQNLTSRGLGLISNPNFETGIIIEQTEGDLYKLKSIFDNSTVLDDILFNEISNWIEENSKNFNKITFPFSISNKIKQDLENLWVLDFPLINFNDFENNLSSDESDHLKEIFNFNSIDNFKKHKDALIKNSKIYKWLLLILKKNDNSLYFGKLSEIIHNAIKDDPKPYRKSIKELQNNLYSFLKIIEDKEIFFDQPNHSVRLYLKS